MVSRSIKTRLLLIVAVLVLALLTPAAALPLETYIPRDVVKAPYGSGEAEFGFKNWDGECMGALFFAVDAHGAIYVYDGIKGNIKVYGNNGAFLKVIRAITWDSRSLLPVDMALNPGGDIYVLCETFHPRDRYRVFVRPAGMDTVKTVPAAYPWSFGRSEDGGPLFDATRIVADQLGNIYLADSQTWRTVRIVQEGRTLSASSQLSSFQEGVPTPAGGRLYYRGLSRAYPLQTSFRLLDGTGKLIRDLSHLPGQPLGTDSLGNVFMESWVGPDSALCTRITKFSPHGIVLAWIDSPTSEHWTTTYGKGSWIVGNDGSVYEMIGGEKSVRVHKWEKVK